MTLPPPPDAHAIAVLSLVVLALFLFTREWRCYRMRQISCGVKHEKLINALELGDAITRTLNE